MHKKILGVVILAALAATALGVVILKKDRAPAAQPASALSEKVVMVPPPASAPIPAPVPTMVPPVSPVPGMAPTGSPPPPPVPAVAGTRPVPVAPPSAGGGPGAAPLAPSGSVPAVPGTLAPPQPGMPSATLGDSLDGIETMPRELKPQRVSMFLKLTAEQQLVSAEYFMALDRVNSEEIQSLRANDGTTPVRNDGTAD